MTNRSNMIPIAGRLHCVAEDEPVCGADEVLYEPEGGTPVSQDDLNERFVDTSDKMDFIQENEYNKPASTGTTGDYPYNGMGRVVLKKNMVEGVNTLTQDMFYKGEVGSRVPKTNTVFVIKYDYTIGNMTSHDVTFTGTHDVNVDGVSYITEAISLHAGQAIFTDRFLYDGATGKIVTSYFATSEKTIHAACPYSGYVNVAIKDFYKISDSVIIPDNCILEFEGGSINNGAIKFSNTQLKLHNHSFNNCLFDGSISGKSVNLMAFGPKCSSIADDSWLVNSVIDICDENGVIIDFDFENNLYISTASEGEKAGWAHRNQIMVGKNTHIKQTSKGWIVLRYSTEAGGIIEPKYISDNNRENTNTVLEGLRIDGNNIHDGIYGENGIGVPGVIRDCVVKNCITEEGENWQNGGGGKGISFESSDLDVFVENCAVYNCNTGFCYSSYANDKEINVFVNGLIVDGCKYGIRLKDQLLTTDITTFRSNVVKINNCLLRNCTSDEAPIILSRIYGASITNCTIEGPETNRINAYIRGSMMGCIFDILCGQKAESFVDFTDPSAQPYQPTDIAENMFRFRASQARSNNSVYWLVKYSDSEGLTKNIAKSNHFDVTTNYAGLKLVNDEAYISKILNNSINVLSRDENGVYHFSGTIQDLYSNLGGNNFINLLGKITDNKSGLSSQRPTFTSGTNVGFMYFDYEINSGKKTPIWWDGANWVDATGTPV